MRAVYRKELRTLLTSWNGWLAAAVVAGFFGVFGYLYHFVQRYATFEMTAASASLSVLIAAPLIAMGLFSDERRDHTDRLLASLPRKLYTMALGKVFAALTMALLCALFALPGVLLLALGSSLYAPMALAAWGLVALMLFASTAGCAFLSMGCPNRLWGFLCGAALMALCYYSGDIVSALSAATFSPVFLLILAAITVLLVFAAFRNASAAIVCAVLAVGAALLLQFMGQSSAVTGALVALFNALNLYAGIDLLYQSAGLSLASIWHLVAFAALCVLFAALAARGRIFIAGRRRT